VTSRRIFLVTLAGGILAASLAAEAQREAFLQGLRELEWIDGQTVTIEYRSAEGSVNRLSALAEFVQLKVDVIVLAGPQAIHAARRATSTIPFVFVTLSDPVTTGLVASLARPGGNMTGLASRAYTRKLEAGESDPTLNRRMNSSMPWNHTRHFWSPTPPARRARRGPAHQPTAGDA
jgi:hypothetical protein